MNENPITSLQYRQLLGLNPALTSEINRQVRDVLFTEVREVQKSDLDDNTHILPEPAIEQAKVELIAALENLGKLTGDPQRIVVIADGCFTNTQLLILLRRILGKENYRKFVKTVPIDYDAEADHAYLGEQLANNNTLYFLGGSLSDTYSMHDSHYDSPLAEMIKEVSDEYAPRYVNKRIIGICFGQQYIANVIGVSRNTSGIIATLK